MDLEGVMEEILERLAESNRIGYGWAMRAGAKRTKYFSFTERVRSNPEVFREVFGEDYEKFVADIPTMFYVDSITNMFCEQYKGMVYKHANRYKRWFVDMEEVVLSGIKAIWRALYEYRDTKSKINTWISMNIRRYTFKTAVLLRKEARKKIGIKVVNTKLDADPKALAPDLLAEMREGSEEVLLERLCERAGVTPENRILLRFYIQKDALTGWRDAYLEDFYRRTGERTDKTSLTWRLNRLKETLLEVVGGQSL